MGAEAGLRRVAVRSAELGVVENDNGAVAVGRRHEERLAVW